MKYEIHVYLGSACIANQYNHRYPLGERHPFLLYLRADDNSEYNLQDAKNKIIDLDLNEIEFSKVGKLSPEKVNTDEKREYYNNALKNEKALIVYSDPV